LAQLESSDDEAGDQKKEGVKDFLLTGGKDGDSKNSANINSQDSDLLRVSEPPINF